MPDERAPRLLSRQEREVGAQRSKCPRQLDEAAGKPSEGSESLSGTAQPQDTEACKGAGQAAGETEHAPNAEKQSRRRISSKGAHSIQEASGPTVDRKEAQALVEEVLGKQTVQWASTHCQSLQSVLDRGGPPAHRAQQFFDIFLVSLSLGDVNSATPRHAQTQYLHILPRMLLALRLTWKKDFRPGIASLLR